MIFGVAILNSYIFALDLAEFSECSCQSRRDIYSRGARREPPNLSYLCLRLGLGVCTPARERKD